MIPEILDATLWMVRVAVRDGARGTRAGHGYADSHYRPPWLPFASVLGPLSIEVEPERETREARRALVMLPGHLVGTTRTNQSFGAGSLHLRFDGEDRATVAVAGANFAVSGTGPAVAAAIEQAIHAAAAAGQFSGASGAPVTDPARLAELQLVTCRWDTAASAIAIASGRRGAVPEPVPSSVEVLAGSGSVAAALGLEAPAQRHPGRFVTASIPAPRAFAVDVRVDLWADNQRSLARLVDALTSVVPIRGWMPTRPALLAEDAPTGSRTLRLLDRGEPTTSTSLLHLEGAGLLVDRVTDRSLTLSAGAAVGGSPQVLTLTNGTASIGLLPAPAVPDPRRPDRPAPRGLALSLGLRIAAAAPGQSVKIATLSRGANDVLTLSAAASLVNDPASVPPGPPAKILVVDLTAAADVAGPGGTATVQTVRRVPLSAFAASNEVHASLDARRGAIDIFVGGEPQRLDDPFQTPVPPILVPGAPSDGDDMLLVLGNAANAFALEVAHVHLHAEPAGPLDPRLREAVHGASRFAPGDRIGLGASDGGFSAGGGEFLTVEWVEGDVVHFDPPLSKAWRRSTTLVHGEQFFFHQLRAKRADDLVNRLYRYSVSYRVSALLEDVRTRHGSRLVEVPEVELERLDNPKRSASGSPSVRAVDPNPFRSF